MNYDSIYKADLFAGQNIIVTGGGSGIGRCTAHELAALGAKVIITGRKQDKLDAVAAEIAEDGGVCASASFDIRDEDAVRDAVKAIIAEHGEIHALVNNAGGQYPAPLMAISKKGWDAVVAYNLTGGFLVAREVFNQSMKKTGGAIVNMLADMWGGTPGMGHSGAARMGMLSFTETAAVEWAFAGVRVNAVAPGWIASSGLDTYDENFIKDVIPQMKGGVPLQRLGTEAEISSCIVFLLSPGASFVSGQCIAIDGAASRNTKLFPLLDQQRSKPYDGFHRAVTPEAVKNL